MQFTWALNRLKWYWRVPLKWLIFAFVAVAVCYPNARLLLRDISRWRNPNSVVNPDSPALQPLVDEVAQSVRSDSPKKQTMGVIEKVVLARIEYAFDWDNWGVADYIPTVEEIMERRREDCDGRAVIAASLLRRFGIHADVVADFAHVWVRTDEGDLMGPGKVAAVVATDQGVRVNWAGLFLLPSAFAYGAAVFPAGREIIILAAGWLLLLRRNGLGSVGLSLILLLAGLWLLRAGGADYRAPKLMKEWASLVLLVVGVGVASITPHLSGVVGRNRKVRRDRESGSVDAQGL